MSWWHAEGQGGRNMLKGVEGDTSNPIRMSDDDILYFLYRIQAARDDFNRVLPTLLPEEQARLIALVENNPTVKTSIVEDERAFLDRLQSNEIRQGVRVRF